jgi:hypothetical protein
MEAGTHRQIRRNGAQAHKPVDRMEHVADEVDPAGPRNPGADA